MKEAFIYMLKDTKISQKAAIFLVFLFIASVCSGLGSHFGKTASFQSTMVITGLILSFFSFVVGFINAGYSISCKRAVVEQKENIVLPFVNIGKNFITGFKFCISIMLLIIALVALGILFILIGNVISPIITLLYYISFIVLLVCFTMAFTYIFVVTDSWLSFFKFKDAVKIMSKWQYWKSVLVILGLSILNSIIAYCTDRFLSNSISNIFAGSAIMCLIGVYFVYVFAYIVANCAAEEVRPTINQ